MLRSHKEIMAEVVQKAKMHKANRQMQQQVRIRSRQEGLFPDVVLSLFLVSLRSFPEPHFLPSNTAGWPFPCLSAGRMGRRAIIRVPVASLHNGPSGLRA